MTRTTFLAPFVAVGLIFALSACDLTDNSASTEIERSFANTEPGGNSPEVELFRDGGPTGVMPSVQTDAENFGKFLQDAYPAPRKYPVAARNLERFPASIGATLSDDAWLVSYVVKEDGRRVVFVMWSKQYGGTNEVEWDTNLGGQVGPR